MLFRSDPEIIPAVQYQHEKAFHRWTVFLIDWGGNASLQDVSGRILWAYPGSTAVVIQVPRGVGPKAQMKIEIQTNPDFTAI